MPSPFSAIRTSGRISAIEHVSDWSREDRRQRATVAVGDTVLELVGREPRRDMFGRIRRQPVDAETVSVLREGDEVAIDHTCGGHALGLTVLGMSTDADWTPGATELTRYMAAIGPRIRYRRTNVVEER